MKRWRWRSRGAKRQELQRRIQSLRFYYRQYVRWHDAGQGRPAHESIKQIVANEDHRFWWLTPSFNSQPRRTRYYCRLHLPESRGD